MKALRFDLAFVIAAISASVCAGPVEEVNEIAAPRIKALTEGNVDGWVAAYADNAVLHSYGSPFRLEGKEAIRGYFINWFQVVPKRKLIARAGLSRAYGDTLVIQDGQGDYYVTDPQGKMTYVPLRWSVVWSKASGQWQIVEQHTSRLPNLE